MTTKSRLTTLLLLCSPLCLAAQGPVLPERPPVFDREAMAAFLYDHASGSEVRLGREMRVDFFVTQEGVLHSPFIRSTELQVVGRTDLFRALEGYRMEPATDRGRPVEGLASMRLRFERVSAGGETSYHITVDGETFAFPPLPPLTDPVRAPITGPPILGATTPPSLSAPALSMELNMVSLSYTEIFDGTIVASIVVEPDGRHGGPIRVESDVDPRFTADVIDVLRGVETTPGRVKGRAVRSLLEVRLHCSGVKSAAGGTDQGIRVAQSAPIPVPEGEAVAMDTVAIPERGSEMVEQETTIYRQIEAPVEPEERTEPVVRRTVVDPPADNPAPVELAPDEPVTVLEVGASYDPDELSRLMVFPEGTAERGREEFVVLNVHVTPEGKAGVVEVLAGSWQEMEGPAVMAVRQLAFEPATVNGRPVESTVVITVRYVP